MGREKTLLLAILGALTGAFVGVLSMKLLVPRPPAGTGPDVDPVTPIAEKQELVEPPALASTPERPAAPPIRDPFTARSAFEQPVAEPPAALAPPPTDLAPPPSDIAPPPAVIAEPRPESPITPVAGTHVVQPGDSWWSLAERAYGDGKNYRALFAWNRAREPQIALAPGTRLEIPPLPRLQAAWPKLVPQ
jgi:5'-nucleotidase